MLLLFWKPTQAMRGPDGGGQPPAERKRERVQDDADAEAEAMALLMLLNQPNR